MSESLSDKVRRVVDPKTYYDREINEKIHWPTSIGAGEPRVNCLFHHDNHTPSLHMNPVTGAWFCHGCEAGGKSIVSFHAKLYGLTPHEAAESICHSYVRPVIVPSVIREHHERLMATPTALQYLMKQRGLSQLIVERHKLGFDGNRFTFPIQDEFDLWVNIKFYDPLAKARGLPKMVNYHREDEERSYGSPVMTYPIRSLTHEPSQTVVLCEGELDTLLMLSFGITAVTMTGGVKSWDVEHTELFRGKEVVIAYDSDPSGERQTHRIAMQRLKNVALVIKRLEIPPIKMPMGEIAKDVTDWWKVDAAMSSRRAWLKAFKESRILLQNDPQVIEKSAVIYVPLDQATRSEWYNKRFRTEAIVTGKDTAPFMLPEVYRVSCSKKCDECPLAEFDGEFKEKKVIPTDPRVLNLVDQPQAIVKKTLLTMAGIQCQPKCQARLEVVKTFNLEQLMLIPTLSSSYGYNGQTSGSGQYVMRQGYFIGHGLKSNYSYEFEGITTVDPSDQHATHLFDVAKPVQTQVETFSMTPEVFNQLCVFKPRSGTRLLAHIMAVAEWQSRNISHIRERPDLHIAVDLVFHSVRGFKFNGEVIQRGMLDALIIGDTRCGKGFVTEGLARYYGLGEIASGENCTFAGLIGGLQQSGKRWFVTWGLIPLNNDRLVVIDEASSLAEVDIGRMSRVRSEGIAEISKIVRESTRANTRLVWLSNPRSGRSIMSYNNGVQAIKELMGANEDVSRFDFAMTVATDEVASEIINCAPDQYRSNGHSDAHLFPAEVCRSLILWAWSRQPTQIRFTALAEAKIINRAIEFGRKYSASIPLVQAENIRIKLAKISAAMAAMVFSSDETGELIVVEPQHVDCVCQFLELIYSKPSMGYDTFSSIANKADLMTEVNIEKNPVSLAIDKVGEANRLEAIAGLLQLHRVSVDGLTDYLGDDLLSKSLIGDLVKLQCLTRVGNDYYKNPSFSKWLRSQKDLQEGEMP